MSIPELHQLFLKHPHAFTDTRKLIPGGIFFALKGPNFNGNDYAEKALEQGAAFAVVDHVPLAKNEKCILVEDVLTALQDLAKFHRHHHKATIISLTGSNGKTTTKELIREVLSQKYETIATVGNLNNHIGVPLTLLRIKETTEMAVVEMGANHQKEIAFLSAIAEPDFGYITNFGKAHLEGFGGVQGVIKGKSELYDHLIAGGKYIFLNGDDPIQQEKLGSYIKKIGFSTSDSRYYQIQNLGANPFVKLKLEGREVSTNLIGNYNFSNCAVAILIGKYFNVPMEEIFQAISNYVPENNRSQIIQKAQLTIILDAYNANPSSMQAALDHFKSIEALHKIAVLGDMFELGEDAAVEHRKIAEIALNSGLKTVILVGENFYNTQAGTPRFQNYEALSKAWSALQIPEDAHILIKGSRGMALERVLDLL